MPGRASAEHPLNTLDRLCRQTIAIILNRQNTGLNEMCSRLFLDSTYGYPPQPGLPSLTCWGKAPLGKNTQGGNINIGETRISGSPPCGRLAGKP